MERPETFANLWIILQAIGFIIALDGVAEFVPQRHYHNTMRQIIILVVDFFFGPLDRDPAQPRLPESWEEWFNS
jgi:hypothetical protein